MQQLVQAYAATRWLACAAAPFSAHPLNVGSRALGHEAASERSVYE